MNNVYLRLIVLKNNKVVEVMFDSRLSFKENMEMYKEIEDLSGRQFEIYDDEKQLFLDLDVPLSEMKIERFTKLYLL